MKAKKLTSILVLSALATTILAGTALAKPGKGFGQEIKFERQMLQQNYKTFKADREELREEKVHTQKELKKAQKEIAHQAKKAQHQLKKIAKSKWTLKNDLFNLRSKLAQVNKPVTSEQAIVGLVKAMGLDLDAQASMREPLITKFKISPSARGYVYEAVYHQLLTPEQLFNLIPNKPLTRVNLAELIVKAKALPVDAAAYVASNDAAAIPVDKAAYVSADVYNGYMSLDKDNNFKPFKPITRSEFASVLIKAGFNATAFMPQYYQLRGSVVSVTSDPASILLQNGDTQIPYAVYATAPIRVNGQAAALADIKAGMQVSVRIADNVVVEIRAIAK